jgi:hypothetical protein
MIFPQNGGMDKIRDLHGPAAASSRSQYRLKRWILVTMNRRFSTDVRRFPPKHHPLLGREQFPLPMGLTEVKDKLNRGPMRKRAPQAKANRRCRGASVEGLDLVGAIQVLMPRIARCGVKHTSYFEVRRWSSFSSSATATAALFCPINV